MGLPLWPKSSVVGKGRTSEPVCFQQRLSSARSEDSQAPPTDPVTGSRAVRDSRLGDRGVPSLREANFCRTQLGAARDLLHVPVRLSDRPHGESLDASRAEYHKLERWYDALLNIAQHRQEREEEITPDFSSCECLGDMLGRLDEWRNIPDRLCLRGATLSSTVSTSSAYQSTRTCNSATTCS